MKELFKVKGNLCECNSLQVFGPALENRSEHWRNSRPGIDLFFDRSIKVFRTRESGACLKAIYGPLAPLRGLSEKARIVFARPPLIEVTAIFPIPIDSVIFAPPSADRLVLVSHESKSVIKFFRTKSSKQGSPHQEIVNLNLLAEAGLDANVPRCNFERAIW